jgi:hypothetical protein
MNPATSVLPAPVRETKYSSTCHSSRALTCSDGESKRYLPQGFLVQGSGSRRTIGFQEPRGVRRIVELDAHRRAPLEPLEQCRDKSYSCCSVTARAPSAPASRASPRSPSARASPNRLRSMYPSHRSNQSRRSPNRRYFSGQRARIVASHQYRARFTSHVGTCARKTAAESRICGRGEQRLRVG